MITNTTSAYRRGLLAAAAALILLSGCGRRDNTAAGSSADAPPPRPAAAESASASAPAGASSEESGDAELESAADALLADMAAGDFEAVSAWADPRRGVTFTPYSTVNPQADYTATAEELAQFSADPAVHTWGIYDGSGEPIRMTAAEYWARFVWNTDYTKAPDVSVNTAAQSGNSPENAADAYPDAQFVEYHFSSLDPQYGGADWCALKLVFVRQNGAWKLRGIIHSEMTL